jgi:hypothetical protein
MLKYNIRVHFAYFLWGLLFYAGDAGPKCQRASIRLHSFIARKIAISIIYCLASSEKGSPLCNFLQPPVTFSAMGPNVPLSSQLTRTIAFVWIPPCL